MGGAGASGLLSELSSDGWLPVVLLVLVLVLVKRGTSIEEEEVIVGTVLTVEVRLSSKDTAAAARGSLDCVAGVVIRRSGVDEAMPWEEEDEDKDEDPAATGAVSVSKVDSLSSLVVVSSSC